MTGPYSSPHHQYSYPDHGQRGRLLPTQVMLYILAGIGGVIALLEFLVLIGLMIVVL